MPKNKSTATRSDETRQRVKALTDKQEAGVKDVFESDSYRAYLQAVSKFHHYSFGNVMLIILQFPDASVVAGYRAWQKNFGRTVKKGEHGIQILAPQQVSDLVLRDKLDPGTGKPVIGKDGKPVQEWAYEKRTTFRPAYVFDVSQTEGKPLPEIGVRSLLSGTVDALYAFRSEVEHLPGVDFITLLENDLALLVPQGHRLWNKNKISITDIQNENLIQLGQTNRRFRTYSLTTSFLQHLGLGQERFISVNSFTDLVIRVLAGEGLGISAVYDSDFTFISKEVKKIILDIPHLDAGDFVFAYREDDPKISDLADKLREMLK